MIVTVPPAGNGAPASGVCRTTTFLSMFSLTPTTVEVNPSALSATCASSRVLPRSCGTAMARVVGLGWGTGVGLGGTGDGVGTGVGTGVGDGSGVSVGAGGGVLVGTAT